MFQIIENEKKSASVCILLIGLSVRVKYNRHMLEFYILIYSWNLPMRGIINIPFPSMLRQLRSGVTPSFPSENTKISNA